LKLGDRVPSTAWTKDPAIPNLRRGEPSEKLKNRRKPIKPGTIKTATNVNGKKKRSTFQLRNQKKDYRETKRRIMPIHLRIGKTPNKAIPG